MRQTKQLQGALIGAGRISHFHLRAWQRIPQAKIVAIADVNLDNAQARAQEFGLDLKRTYATLADLLQHEKNLDFIDLVTPVDARVELVKLAAEHGLHINCQKPFARTLADAREMIQICQTANVVLNINENWRWRTWYRQVKQMIEAGKIGRPLYARIFSHDTWRAGKSVPKDSPLRQWRRGILFRWGIHHIDVLRFLFGEPISVYARMARLPADIRAESRILLTLAFDHDLTALLDLSSSSYAPQGHPDRVTHNVEDVRLEGSRGTILLSHGVDKGDVMRLESAEEAWQQPAYDGEPIVAYERSYVDTQRHFIECLLQGATPETNGLDNFETLAITLAAYHAAEHNQVINIAEFRQMN